MDEIKRGLIQEGLHSLGFYGVTINESYIDACHHKALGEIWEPLKDTGTHVTVYKVGDGIKPSLSVRERKSGEDLITLEEMKKRQFCTDYRITLSEKMRENPLVLARFILAQKGAGK